MKVLCLNGSPRKDGNTALLLSKLCQTLQTEGITTETVSLSGKKLRGCTACFACARNKNRDCAVKDDFNPILKSMIESDALVLGSPTYFTDVTAELKAMIDRSGFVAVMNGGLFRGKVGAAVAAVRRAGAVHVFDTINHLFLMNRMFVVGSTYWNLGIGLEKGDVQSDTEGMNNMEDLGKSMAFLLKKLHA
jgi:multimeric flavodoxin WrbA